MIQFNINAYKSKFNHKVIIHENKREYVSAAEEHSLLWKNGESGFDETGGLYHPFEKYVRRNGKWKRTNNIGIVRFFLPVHPRVVYHEVLHAALWEYRLKHKRKCDFGREIDKREEEMVHIYDQLLVMAIRKLYAQKIW